jgi:hypothetical protein
VKKKHKHHHDWGGKKDDRMPYEKGGTMTFVAGSEAYRDGWDRIFGRQEKSDDSRSDSSSSSGSGM